MGLTDFIKTVKKIFTGDDGEYEDDYRFKNLDEDSSFDTDEYSSDDDVELDDDDLDDDDDVRIPESLQKKYEKALEKFYSNLSEKAMEDEDLSDMMDDIETKFWEGKIQDPAAAINKVYQKWKTSRPQRNQQKGNNRAIIIDMLRRYDELTKEEKESLTEYSNKYCLRHLKSSDEDAVTEIIKSWYETKSLTDEKFEIINGIKDSECHVSRSDCDSYCYDIDEIPLTKEDYNQRIVIFKNDDDYYDDYDKFADYFKKYWLKSGNQPEPIRCGDLIVNRPCFLKSIVDLASPHFHMGKRCFEEDSFQSVTLYLFADSIEYLADGGHFTINLSDIIEVSLNNWSYIRNKCRSLDEKRRNGYDVPDSAWPDPQLLEITCRNQKKTLFTYDSCQPKVDLLVLQALIYYFIKKPQVGQQSGKINKAETFQQDAATNEKPQGEPQEIVPKETIQQQTIQKDEMKSESKIFFQPWVGSDYNTGGVFGKKVLVLGESHYGDAPDQTDDTIGTIKEFVYDYWGESYQQTFLCFERALAGREISQEEREQLWNSIMFYNYFQKSTTGPRTAPDMTVQQESEEAFHELLAQYQPDAIIVWGQRLYNLLPAWDGTESSVEVDGDSCPVWNYLIKGKSIPAMRIYHPSAPAGKNWELWHQFHKAFIGEPQFK